MIVEKIVQDYESDHSILFMQDSEEILVTRLPSYPQGTHLFTKDDYILMEDEQFLSFHDFFMEVDLSLKTIDAFLKYEIAYDTDIYKLYKKTPYKLLQITDKELVPYLSFEEYLHLCIPTTFDQRIEEIKQTTLYVIDMQKEKTGSTCFLLYDIYKGVNHLLLNAQRPLSFQDFYAFISFLEDFFHLFHSPNWKQDKVCLPEDYEIERSIYTFIHDKLNSPSPFARYLFSGDMSTFASSQQLAMTTLPSHDGFLSILTGGPGTGKTTILKEIVRCLKESYPQEFVTMLAPTGRAAKRIREVMAGEEIEISTIHKFLDFRMIGGKFLPTRSPSRMEEIRNTHFIIIDEASMLSNSLFATLLTYLDLERTKILLVGDVNQLPSIDAGCLLKDLIDLGVYTVRLSENFRSDGSIVENAGFINNGISNLSYNQTFELTEESLDISSISHLEDVLILSPYRAEQKDQSTSNINKLIHDEIFKNYPPVSSKFRPGDRVLITRTRYIDGIAKYVNGDVGIIISVQMLNESDPFGDPDQVTYLYEVLIEDYTVYVAEDDLDYGYAITIHKSQGSEERIVHILLPSYAPFITRKMLYTAVTRAKEKVVLHSTKEVLKRIIDNNRDDERETVLHIQSSLEKN